MENDKTEFAQNSRAQSQLSDTQHVRTMQVEVAK